MTDKVKVSQEELAGKVDVADWLSLRAHMERGRLVLVDTLLELSEVAVGVADDNVKVIERWIVSGLIGKPTAQQIEEWDRDRQKHFLCLIVSPFVLIQEVPKATA